MSWFSSFQDIIHDRKEKWKIQTAQDQLLNRISDYCQNPTLDKQILNFILYRNHVDRSQAQELERASWSNKMKQYNQYKNVLNNLNNEFEKGLKEYLKNNYRHYCINLQSFFETISK